MTPTDKPREPRAEAPAGPRSPPPRIDSRTSFAQALLWAFDAAFADNARRIVCCDRDFAHWPLDEKTLLTNLATWLRLPQRRLVLLAETWDEVPRRHPRFTGWRRDWVHAIDTWQASAEQGPSLPSVLASDSGAVVHLIDAVHWRGRAQQDAREAKQWSEQLDVVLQQCERGFAANTLGL